AKRRLQAAKTRADDHHMMGFGRRFAHRSISGLLLLIMYVRAAGFQAAFANRAIASRYRKINRADRESFGLRKTSLTENPNKEPDMRRTVIRYKARPEAADRNAELVTAVFAELQASQPEGVRYLTLRLEDDSFVHIVETTAEDG